MCRQVGALLSPFRRQLETEHGMSAEQVIYTNDYQNGSLGIVDELKEKSVIVRLYNGSYVEVKPHDFEVTDYEVQEETVERVVIGNDDDYFNYLLKMANND